MLLINGLEPVPRYLDDKIDPRGPIVAVGITRSSGERGKKAPSTVQKTVNWRESVGGGSAAPFLFPLPTSAGLNKV